MLVRLWRKGTLVHCWWDCKLVQSLWQTVWISLKKLKTELPWSNNFTSGYLSKENKNTNLKIWLQCYIHCTITSNSQDMNTVLMSINRWMNKEVVSYIYMIYTFIFQQLKKNEMLPFVRKNIGGPKSIMLSEVGQ